MNYLRLSVSTGILTLALALPAFAGWMDTTIASPPPPPETGQMNTASAVAATGFMDTPVTEIALSFVENMLSLF